MSTKSTIAHGDDFHLYNDYFDEDGVYLELEGITRYETGPGSVMVRIPVAIWEYIRQFPGIDLDWAGKTDAEIRAIVEKEVDERIAEYRRARSQRHKAFVSFSAAGVYGEADAPRASQIRSGLKVMLRRRDFQRAIQDQIRHLEWAASPEGRQEARQKYRREHPREIRRQAAQIGWIRRKQNQSPKKPKRRS